MALPAPAKKRADTKLAAAIRATTRISPRPSFVDIDGVALCAGTSSISHSSPPATAAEPRYSLRWARRPWSQAASGTANTSVATLMGCTMMSGAKLSADRVETGAGEADGAPDPPARPADEPQGRALGHRLELLEGRPQRVTERTQQGDGEPQPAHGHAPERSRVWVTRFSLGTIDRSPGRVSHIHQYGHGGVPPIQGDNTAAGVGGRAAKIDPFHRCTGRQPPIPHLVRPHLALEDVPPGEPAPAPRCRAGRAPRNGPGSRRSRGRTGR